MEMLVDDNQDLSDTEITSAKTEPIDAISTVFNQDIRPFIEVIDTLRRIGVHQDVPLPNVVVVGDQSSGKSSIIEALSGIQLPRGKGIVTRCPLELQLKRVFHGPWRANLSYIDRNGDKQEKQTLVAAEVETFIHEAQTAICGLGKDVSDQLITLRVESPITEAPDLTLIDLPGIARIAQKGQSDDVCEKIRKVIKNYVKHDNTVILCIISANLDFAVNESIQIAQTNDPKGLRTIGVITKPDLADSAQKHDAVETLNNQKHILKKGYIMVKCRTQDELDRKMSLEESLDNEREFFSSDYVYQTANPNQLGTMSLARKISEELVDIIKKSLPQLKASIEDALYKARESLGNLPAGLPDSESEKHIYLNKIVWKFSNDLKKCLQDGKNTMADDNWYYSWRKEFNNFSDEIEKKREKVMNGKFSANNMVELISRKRGKEISGFLSFDLFEDLMKTHVETYKPDAMNLAMRIYKSVEDKLLNLAKQAFNHLPEVEKDIKELIVKECKKACEEAHKKVGWIFKQEHLIFTMDVGFQDEMAKLVDKEQQIAAKSKNLIGEAMMVDAQSNSELMKRMLKVYLKIVNKRLSDRIPMTIMQCILVDMSEEMDTTLLKYTSSPNSVKKVVETRKLSEDRARIISKIERLQSAEMELTRF